MKNETVEITVALYLASTVNHATMDEMAKIADYTNLARAIAVITIDIKALIQKETVCMHILY